MTSVCDNIYSNDNIRREISAMSPATLRSVMNNALVRARSCIAVEGQHKRDIIY